MYFYHLDHLGSSSYITDREGRITQHTEYIAFGEVLFEEHSTSRTIPYLFNGKELDTETGLYYYGARYYDPKISLWLNVDPLAEKYPHVSPYTYTLNNPIMLVDPTGMESEDPIGPGYYTATTNSKTLGFSLRHPIAALSIGLPKKGSTNISTNSVRFSTRIGLEENTQKEGSQVNAYRHTLWQAEITKNLVQVLLNRLEMLMRKILLLLQEAI